MNIAERLRTTTPPYSKAETRLIAEAAYNILYGVVLLTKDEKQYFKEHKQDIRLLVGESDWIVKRNALSDELVTSIKTAALRHLDG